MNEKTDDIGPVIPNPNTANPISELEREIEKLEEGEADEGIKGFDYEKTA